MWIGLLIRLLPLIVLGGTVLWLIAEWKHKNHTIAQQAETISSLESQVEVERFSSKLKDRSIDALEKDAKHVDKINRDLARAIAKAEATPDAPVGSCVLDPALGAIIDGLRPYDPHQYDPNAPAGSP